MGERRRYAEAEKHYSEYLALKGFSKETCRTYPTAVRPFWDWCGGTEKARESKRAECRQFIAEQIAAFAPSTVRNRLFAVRVWFEMIEDDAADDAIDNGLEAPNRRPNPTASITPPKREETEPLPEVPLEDERRLVYRATSERDQAMWLILIETGMRIGELVKMQVEDIRWTEAAIAVHGKGRKSRLAWLGPETLGLLRGIIGARNSGPVWLTRTVDPNTGKAKPVTRDGARNNFWRLSRRAGVAAHPHQLRATFANRWLDSGGDEGALQEAMGHSQLAMTHHYAGANKKKRAEEISRRLGLAGAVLGSNVVDFDAARAARQA